MELIAPAGFGKTSLAEAAACAMGSWHRIAPRLEEVQDARRANYDTVIIDNADAAEDDDLAELATAIAQLLKSTRVIVCSRTVTPLHRSLELLPHEVLEIHSVELALQEHEVAAILGQQDADPRVLREVEVLSEGWPIVVLSMKRALEDNGAITCSGLASLYAYLDDAIVQTLEPSVRETFLICAGLRGIPVTCLAAAGYSREAQALMGLELTTQDTQFGVRVRPMLERLADSRYEREMIAALKRAGLAFEHAQMPAYAAAARLRCSDISGAAQTLRQLRSDPRSLTAFPYRSLNNAASMLSISASLRCFPELWLALFFQRRHFEPPAALLHDALDIVNEREPLTPELHDAFVAVIATLTTEAGCPKRGYALLNRSLARRSNGEAAMFLELARAILDAHSGKPPSAIRWADLRQYFAASDAWFTEVLRVELKMMRAHWHNSTAFSYVGRMVAVADRSGCAAIEAYVLAWGTCAAWLYGDDERFKGLLAELRRALESVDSVPLHAMVDAFCGSELRNIDDFPVYDCWVKLIVAASSSAPDAHRLLRRAVEIADAIEDTALRILTRLALSRIEANGSAELEDQVWNLCRSLTPVDAKKNSTLAAIRERLSRFLTRFDQLHARSGGKTSDSILIEVTSGRVFRGGAELKVSYKVLELLTFLAVEGHPVTRETLVSKLWLDQAAHSAVNSLKSCAYRARQQLGVANAIIFRNAAYELGPQVKTDIQAMEHVRWALDDGRPVDIEQAARFFDLLIAGRASVSSTWEWFASYESALVTLTNDLGLYLARTAFDEGDLDRMQSYALALTHLDPCDEAATELLIRAHLLKDERQLALARYQRLARCLRTELDTEPSAAIQELFNERREA